MYGYLYYRKTKNKWWNNNLIAARTSSTKLGGKKVFKRFSPFRYDSFEWIEGSNLDPICFEEEGKSRIGRSRTKSSGKVFLLLFLNGGHGSLRPNYTCRSGSGDQKLRQEVKGRECIVKLPLSKHSPRSQVTANTHDISIRLSLFFSSLLPRFQPRSLPPPRFRSLCWKYPQVILKNGPSVSAAMGSNATHGFHPRTTHPHLRKRTPGHTREIYSNFLRFSPRRSSIRGIRSRFE